jgi:hypothetical protein
VSAFRGPLPPERAGQVSWVVPAARVDPTETRNNQPIRRSLPTASLCMFDSHLFHAGEFKHAIDEQQGCLVWLNLQ